MSKFRKKPVVIEAHQFVGTVDSYDAINRWAGSEEQPNGTWRDRVERPQQFGPLLIHSLEGDVTCHEGDWVIKGVKGEFYSCRADIFAETYEAASMPTREEALLAHFRALRAALQEIAERQAAGRWIKERAAAVLAQARDEEGT